MREDYTIYYEKICEILFEETGSNFDIDDTFDDGLMSDTTNSTVCKKMKGQDKFVTYFPISILGDKVQKWFMKNKKYELNCDEDYNSFDISSSDDDWYNYF